MPPWECILSGVSACVGACHQVLAQYESFVLQNYIDLRPDMVWCPRDGCNLAVRYVQLAGEGGGGRLSKRAACDVRVCAALCNHRYLGASADVHCACGHSFCFTCRNLAHSPLSCALFMRWREEKTKITVRCSVSVIRRS